MKTTQIAAEYQALINIFIEEGMVVYHKSKYNSLQTRFVGRVSDEGTDWSLKVSYFNLGLIVRGNGDIVIEDAQDGISKVETPISKYVEGIRDTEQRIDAEYKVSLIKAHSRAIIRAHTTPSVLRDKVSANRELFSDIVKDARASLTQRGDA